VDTFPLLAAGKKEALAALVSRVLAENEVVNLTAMRTEEKCWVGNVIDSLSFLDILTKIGLSQEPANLLDLGTGGGFPLLPLAICLPTWKCMGLDATRKKVEAVARIVAALSLPNVQTHWGRAEMLGQEKEWKNQYDIVTVRAVASIAENLKMAAPFVRSGGCIVLWKSLHIAEELTESADTQKETKCTLVLEHQYELPDPYGKRQLLVFKKSG
jgi:16S rRNA (guanine527-N7)-methyltransferase